jgi:hypothetical protein
LDPNTYLKFAGAALDPRTLGMAAAPINPNWYGQWMGSMASPQSYGPTMNSMMQMPSFGGQTGAMVPAYPQAFPSLPMIDPRMFGGIVPMVPR